MAGQVKFILDAEPAKAVAGFLKILEAQKKVEGGFKAIKKPADEVSTTLGAMGQQAQNFGKDFVAAFSGAATLEGMKSLLKGVVDEIKHAREEVVKFHQSAAGGASMPDYEKNKPEYKRRSIELSNRFGADINQIVNPLREKVYTDASDESPEKREQMVEASLKAGRFGNNPMEFAGVMDNMMDTYKGLSVKQAANASMFLKEKGGLSVGEQGETLAGVLPTMSMMKVPFEQVEALMGMVPQMGGKNSAMGRGLKEAMFKFDELAEGGNITKGAGLFQNFQELAKMQQQNPEEFNKILGKRSAPAVSFVAQNPQMFQSLLAQARGYGKGDRLTDMEANRSPEELQALRAQQAEQYGKNADLENTSGIDALTNHDLRTGYIRKNLPSYLKGVAPLAAGVASTNPLTKGLLDTLASADSAGPAEHKSGVWVDGRRLGGGSGVSGHLRAAADAHDKESQERRTNKVQQGTGGNGTEN